MSKQVRYDLRQRVGLWVAKVACNEHRPTRLPWVGFKNSVRARM